MSPKRRVHIFGVCLFLSILSITTSGSVIEPPFPGENSRHLYWLARNERDEQRRLHLYEEGRAMGEAALAERPGDSGAILWWAANEGAIAETKKNLGDYYVVGLEFDRRHAAGNGAAHHGAQSACSAALHNGEQRLALNVHPAQHHHVCPGQVAVAQKLHVGVDQALLPGSGVTARQPSSGLAEAAPRACPN